jgi:hypothetical protein
MDSTSSTTKFVSTSVDHPRVTKADSSYIRSFLALYDQYSTEVQERARQLTAQDTVTTEPIRPVNLMFCVDIDWLESTISRLIEGISTYEELDDTVLRKYLGEKSEESKEAVNLDRLGEIVDQQLKVNMVDTDAGSRMQNLFVSYHTVVRRNSLAWLLTANQKVAFNHALSAVKPETLHTRLSSDLGFAHHNLKKDFKAFMAHAVCKCQLPINSSTSGPRRSQRTRRTPKTSTGAGTRRRPARRRRTKW